MEEVWDRNKKQKKSEVAAILSTFGTGYWNRWRGSLKIRAEGLCWILIQYWVNKHEEEEEEEEEEDDCFIKWGKNILLFPD